MNSLRAVFSLVAVSLITSCSGFERPNAVPNALENQAPRSLQSYTQSLPLARDYRGHVMVAVVADSEEQLRDNIQKAIAAGQSPAYVTVTTTKSSHVFTAYSSVAATSKTLVVRGYGRVYAFPTSTVRSVRFSGNSSPTPISGLPQITSRMLDAETSGYLYLVSHEHTKHLYHPRNRSAKTSDCSDCSAVLLSKIKSRYLRKRIYGGRQASWQNASYEFWRPGIDAASSIDGSSTPCRLLVKNNGLIRKVSLGDAGGASGCSGGGGSFSFSSASTGGSSGSLGYSSESSGSSGGVGNCSAGGSFSSADPCVAAKHDANATCHGDPIGLGQSVVSNNGSTDVNNVYNLQVQQGPTTYEIGWVYFTVGGQQYFQPDISVTVSGGTPVVQVGLSGNPIIAIGSGHNPNQIGNEMNTWIRAAGAVGLSMPFPFGQIVGSAAANTTIVGGFCFNPSYSIG